MYIYIYICIYIYILMCVCVCVCVYACRYIYTYIYIHIYMHKYVYVHMYTCIFFVGISSVGHDMWIYFRAHTLLFWNVLLNLRSVLTQATHLHTNTLRTGYTRFDEGEYDGSPADDAIEIVDNYGVAPGGETHTAHTRTNVESLAHADHQHCMHTHLNVDWYWHSQRTSMHTDFKYWHTQHTWTYKRTRLNSQTRVPPSTSAPAEVGVPDLVLIAHS